MKLWKRLDNLVHKTKEVKEKLVGKVVCFKEKDHYYNIKITDDPQICIEKRSNSWYGSTAYIDVEDWEAVKYVIDELLGREE